MFIFILKPVKRMIKLLIFFGILPFFVISSHIRNASVIWDSRAEKFNILDYIVNNSVAWGSFENKINITGWSYLEIHTNDYYNDSYQAYAAGLIEGHLTSDLIRMHWNNLFADYCKDCRIDCEKLKNFLETNMNFINKMIKNNRTNSYWHQVALILEQIRGLEDAYMKNISVPNTEPSVMGIMLLNLNGDLDDLETVITSKGISSKYTSCSVLIKLLPELEDLYVAHVTWNHYKTMLRINKKYVLPFKMSTSAKSNKIPGHTMSLSSYPGTILSIDDFYIISSGLVTLETTIINYNCSLWEYVQPDKIVFEWIRNIVSNRLATSGIEWASLFKLYNSGTYNNHWMIVDYKKFTPGNVTSEGLLTILEQLPNFIQFADQTEIFLKQGYWASYNIAFFPEVSKMSESCLYSSYDNDPRALIFKRDQGKVRDLATMIKLMRYNNFKHDNLSCCACTPPYNAIYAISARSDLNPPNGIPEDILDSSAFGATDMKVTTYSLQKEYKFIAQSGPTYDQQPPFQWSKSDFNCVRHEGHPDLWKFEPETHEWLNV